MLTEYKFVSGWWRQWIGSRRHASHRGTMRRHHKGRSSPIVRLAVWFGLATTSELSTLREMCPTEIASYGDAGKAWQDSQGIGSAGCKKRKVRSDWKKKTSNAEHQTNSRRLGVF